MKRPYLWFTILSIIWAVVHTAIFFLRFSKTPPLIEAIYFIPMGILSGGLLIYLAQKAPNHQTRVSAIVGYLVMCPFAFFGSLAGGLLHPLFGVTLLGAIPLILGTLAGYALGKLATDESRV